MPRVLPFRGLRFNPAVVQDLSDVVCPPYDVIGTSQRADLERRSHLNAVHIELPRDLPDDFEPVARYARAAVRLSQWRAENALVMDTDRHYYLHETQFTHAGQPLVRRDLMAAVALAPWSEGQILPHERTMADPLADRLALLRATRANISPLWLLYRDQPAGLVRAWESVDDQPPVIEFALDGEVHRAWALADAEITSAIETEFVDGGPLYMADGHHRYETALAFREEIVPRLPGAGASLAMLTWASDPGLVVLPTHRMLRALPDDFDAAEMEMRWGEVVHADYFPIWEQGTPQQVDAFTRQLASQGYQPPSSRVPREAVDGLLAQVAARGERVVTFGALGPQPDLFSVLELRGGRVPLGVLPADRSEAWRQLDVAILHAVLVDPLVEEAGIPRERALAYTRDPQEAFEALLRGEARMAFFLNPTRVDQVLAVADAGDRMPEKSTYFYPKPPTGLVLRSLEG